MARAAPSEIRILFIVEPFSSPIREQDGPVKGVVVVFSDCSLKQQADSAIKERALMQEQLVKIAATAPGVIHEFQQRPDGSVCFPYASPRIEQIYDLRPEEIADDGPLYVMERGVSPQFHWDESPEPDEGRPVDDASTRRAARFLDELEWYANALKAARQAGVPCAFRNVPFLDDVAEASAVRKQLELALRGAKEKGEAVAIGHPHVATLAALKEILPQAKGRGVQLVFASDLVH